MIPTKFPGVTTYLGAPPGWDHDGELGECMALPIKADEHGLTSLWVPDSDELAALNAGACVQLTIMASAHPVVSVGVSQGPRPSTANALRSQSATSSASPTEEKEGK